LLSNQYLDPRASFLKFKLKNTDSTHKYVISAAGVGSMFESIDLTQSGTSLSSYRNYGIKLFLVEKRRQTLSSIMGVGSMSGMCPDDSVSDYTGQVPDGKPGQRGATIVPLAEMVFCDSLTEHASLFATKK
jgi:hypothetical protein